MSYTASVSAWIDALLIINCFVDLIFACDMALQFVTMYQRKTYWDYHGNIDCRKFLSLLDVMVFP